MDERSRHRQFDEQFFNQLKARAEKLVVGQLPAKRVMIESLSDGSDAVRDELGRLQIYDRGTLEEMPGRQALLLRFQRPMFGGLINTNVARLRARTLVSVEALARGEDTGPIGREAVLDALARYELLPHNQKPSAVALASATGFTPEARQLVERGEQPTLVLLGGREDGGWDISMSAALRKTSWAKLFELETQDAQLRRFMRHLDAQGLELGSSGIAIDALAEQVGLPRDKTEALVRQACRQDARLMTVDHEGTLHICRSPLASEVSSMSLWNRIMRWLGRKPGAAERVRALTEQRVRLEQQRSEIDQQVDVLEAQERDLLKQGAAAPSAAEKKQVAAKLMRARRELKRQRTRAQMFNQQIDVLGTQIHHVTLTEQSKQVALPSAEELAQQAAEAEQVMGDLAASADLATNIEVSAETPMMQEEEAAIFAEFDEIAGGEKTPAAAQRESAAADLAADAPERAQPADEDAPQSPSEKQRPASREMN